MSAQFTPSEHLQLKLLKDRSTQFPIPGSLLKSDKGNGGLQFYKMNIGWDGTHLFYMYFIKWDFPNSPNCSWYNCLYKIYYEKGGNIAMWNRNLLWNSINSHCALKMLWPGFNSAKFNQYWTTAHFYIYIFKGECSISFVRVLLTVCCELLRHWLTEVIVRVFQLIKIKIQWSSCQTWSCISYGVFIS